ncbi:LysR family transcriptional regulator [Nonomuraea sp. NPDC003201]
MELELRHLRVVCAIAEMGSVSGAAARLGLSQPAMTNQLRKIEKVIGGELFVRSRTGAAPTALGNQVVARARIVLAEIDGLFGDLRDAHAPATGLQLGSIHTACVSSMVDRVGEAILGRAISLRIEPSAALLADALAQGRLDAALIGMVEGFGVTPGPPVVSRMLIPRYPFFVALPAGHPLAGKGEIELADLREESWISPPGADDGSLAALRASCRAAGFEPDIRYDAPSGGGHHLVAAGHAVRLVDPTWPAREGTVVLPLSGEPQVGRLVMAWRRDHLSPQAAAAIYRGLAIAFKDHVDDNPVFRRWWDTHPETHPLL